MKKYYIFLILLLGCCSIFAQTPKQNFTKAEEFYKNGNFTEAVKQTERVKTSLGKSNPKVEALLFMAYYNTQDYTKAKIAYETLKLMVPDNVENSSEFALYKSTGEQLDKKLAEIQTAFEKKQNQGSKSLYSYSQYEDKNDNKERRIERKKEAFDNRMEKIQENKSKELDRIKWNTATFLNSIDSYNTYLNTDGDRKYDKEAKEKIEELELQTSNGLAKFIQDNTPRYVTGKYTISKTQLTVYFKPSHVNKYIGKKKWIDLDKITKVEYTKPFVHVRGPVRSFYFTIKRGVEKEYKGKGNSKKGGINYWDTIGFRFVDAEKCK
ncbi:hypothetical protein, partial [Psychroflexus sp. MES1-P1E]|uniref:hypothetical protein n=1 Tax=Psychroflexus sp. MES1-P1E TaxID=2058320 RepID=UPI001C60ABCE